MKTTGIFTVHKHEIFFHHNSEPIYLLPFGDIHRSSPLCAVERWHEFCKWAKNKPNAYFIGMGDYDDLASTSERSILGNENLHESTKHTLEGMYMANTRRLAKEMEFMRGRLIGLIEGNHYGVFQSGVTTTQLLAQMLDCKYLGVLAFIRLYLRRATDKASRGRHGMAIDIYAHHGVGASRMLGGSLNRVQQMAESAVADIYLMGHDHKKIVGKVPRLMLQEGNGTLRIREKKAIFVRTGSFLHGLADGLPSYIADGCNGPTDIGIAKIELTPKDRYQVDIHVSI